MSVRYNVPHLTGRELFHLEKALESRHLAGDGPYTKQCNAWLEHTTGTRKALLTHSCTAALEMAAILAGVGPGDEVIMPSFTFVSTANAFVLRGAVPVFVDVRPDTLNIDENRVEEAVTEKTRAIVPVHYAGIGCEMDALLDVARNHDFVVIEDAAQGILARYKGCALGAIGHLGCLSFHETKNIISGEGGALLINDERFLHRAEIIREKGTNRSQFLRGEVDKYTWVDIGSSYLCSELNAAFLWAQLEEAQHITAARLALWDSYHAAFADLERRERVRRPIVPPGIEHNAHIYYLLLPDIESRTAVVARLRERGVGTAYHYVPLHSSEAGRRFGRASGALGVTDDIADRLVRLPLSPGLEKIQTAVCEAVIEAVESVVDRST